MSVRTACWIVCLCLQATFARGQSLQVESDVTVGHSSDEVSAAATQVRIFGEAGAGVRVFVEGSWGGRSETVRPTDAFGAAYPYEQGPQLIEAYAERLFRPGRALLGIRGGRYRTPFGIHTRSDYAYTGLLRAPLIRYDGYFALSNNFLEDGVELIAGMPQLYVATSLGTPADAGASTRRSTFDSVSRLQAFTGPFIVGLSYITTSPYFPATFARGRSVFTGVDARWNMGGVQLSGEWITGRPFDGTSTDGWHLDVSVHRRMMGPVTALWRSEALNYDAIAPFARAARRHTAGVRVRLPGHVLAQANLLRQSGDLTRSDRSALDVGLTYSIRVPWAPR